MADHTRMLETLRGVGAFLPLDLHFADAMCRMAGDTASPELALSAALVSHGTAVHQHVCLDLAPAVPYRNLMPFFPDLDTSGPGEGAEAARRLARVPVRENLVDAIRPAAVVGAPGEVQPLILAGTRLYLQRYWDYEQRIATFMRSRSRLCAEDFDAANVVGRLPRISRLLAGNLERLQVGEQDWQHVAVFAALRNRLTVITGGPGTGKTTAVAAILALLLELRPDVRVAVCAPTGKAQQRLREAIREEIPNLSCSEAVRAALAGLEAATIHRLLGVQMNSIHFRHSRRNPLDLDVLVVDEASMVDQPLMAKLLDAVPEHARLILLGDKDQLASVEAGSVLADICAAAAVNQFSPAAIAEFATVVEGTLPALPAASAGAALADMVIELRHTHRYDDSGGIGQVKAAVNVGDAATALQAVRAGADSSKGVTTMCALPAPKALESQLRAYLQDLMLTDGDGRERLFRNYASAADLSRAMDVFGRFQILCSHRNGPYGVNAVNRIVRGILGKTTNYAKGLPIMVTRNDARLKLFNGDIGLCWRDANGATRVYFPDAEAEGGYRSFPAAQLPDHDTVYAMTVHKSQGSGFDRVLLILPPTPESPILTRELLYTAVTRAKKRVDIWADDPVLSTAVTRCTQRHSGLEDALKAP